jgi:hypothetical protein
MRLISVAVCAAFLSTTVYAAEIVTPNDDATVEGNTAANATSFPAGQQVLFDVSSTQFGALPIGDVITGFSFRPDTNTCAAGPCSPFTETLENVTIVLATTSIAPTTVDTTFADYLTTNVQTVFSGNLTVSTSETLTQPGGPKVFDITFPFTSGYAYNPAVGNLVLDLVIASDTVTPTLLDASNTTADEMVQSQYFASASAATTGALSPLVDVLEITTSPVPEPGTWALMLLGVGAVGAGLRARRKPALRFA